MFIRKWFNSTNKDEEKSVPGASSKQDTSTSQISKFFTRTNLVGSETFRGIKEGMEYRLPQTVLLCVSIAFWYSSRSQSIYMQDHAFEYDCVNSGPRGGLPSFVCKLSDGTISEDPKDYPEKLFQEGNMHFNETLPPSLMFAFLTVFAINGLGRGIYQGYQAFWKPLPEEKTAELNELSQSPRCRYRF